MICEIDAKAPDLQRCNAKVVGGESRSNHIINRSQEMLMFLPIRVLFQNINTIEEQNGNYSTRVGSKLCVVDRLESLNKLCDTSRAKLVMVDINASSTLARIGASFKNTDRI